jgi:adenine phosphoribosyltransferase
MIDFKKYIDDVPDFPNEGILFRDIQPLLEDETAFVNAITELGKLAILTTDEDGNEMLRKPDYWVGIESRGFLFASALSMRFGGGVKLIRKKGKLPPKNLLSISYDLEYGTDKIQIKEGSGSVIIIDDVYATGGTMNAAEALCIGAGYNVIDKVCLLDIGILKDHDVKCLITYE